MNSEFILEKIWRIEQSLENIKDSAEVNQDISSLSTQIIECCLYISTNSTDDEYDLVNEIIQLLQMLDKKYDFQKIFKNKCFFELLFLEMKCIHA